MGLHETVVIDDLLETSFQDQIQTEVLRGPWIFINDMSYNNSQKPSYGFNQMIKHPNHGILSPLYERVSVPIINKVIDRLGLLLKDIYYNRCFLQVPLAEQFVKETNGVHVDLPIPHLACVYYLNDADGDTVLYEETNETVPYGSSDVKLTEHKRVTPKKGRFVLFDGSRYHASSQPRTTHRCIMNFDLVF